MAGAHWSGLGAAQLVDELRRQVTQGQGATLFIELDGVAQQVRLEAEG